MIGNMRPDRRGGIRGLVLVLIFAREWGASGFFETSGCG